MTEQAARLSAGSGPLGRAPIGHPLRARRAATTASGDMAVGKEAPYGMMVGMGAQVLAARVQSQCLSERRFHTFCKEVSNDRPREHLDDEFRGTGR